MCLSRIATGYVNTNRCYGKSSTLELEGELPHHLDKVLVLTSLSLTLSA